MEISAEMTRLMTNSANGSQREIKEERQKLGTVKSFLYGTLERLSQMMIQNQGSLKD